MEDEAGAFDWVNDDRSALTRTIEPAPAAVVEAATTHAAVTIQLAAGVPLAIVSEVAGHASVSFTDSRYGHLQPEHLRDAAEAMRRAYGAGE